MTYCQLLPHFFQNGFVVPKPLKQLVSPISKWHNPNVKCDYRAVTMGHSTEDYKGFKAKVQELIENKCLTFKEEDLNVKSNLLP